METKAKIEGKGLKEYEKRKFFLSLDDNQHQ